MGSIEHPAFFGDIETLGINHTDAFGISHTPVIRDYPIGPAQEFHL